MANHGGATLPVHGQDWKLSIIISQALKIAGARLSKLFRRERAEASISYAPI